MKTLIDDFSTHLRHHGLRFTKERRQLADLILKMKGHFSTEDVLEKIKQKRMPLSRATVYRLLPVLVKAKLIQQSLLSEDQTLYEVTWNKDHHDHLICKYCNEIIEFQHDTIELLQREIASRYGFTLESHVMELMGRCRECKASAKPLS